MKTPKNPTRAKRVQPVASADKVVGTGFYRDAAPGTFGPNEWLDLLMACQDGRATCMRVLEIIERETVPARKAPDEDALLDVLTNAFLRWPLPASVRVDGCAMEPNYPHRVGTNLLTAIEAKQMLREVVLPYITPPTKPQSKKAGGV